MAGATGHRVPNSLVTLLQPFRDAFTAPTWEHVLVLVMGAILVPGRRTVASALRVMGLGQARHFTNYHRVLNRNAWSAHALSRRLLIRLVDAFVPDGEPVVIAPDDALAAAPAHRRRCRYQLRRHRTARGRAAPGHRGHPPAARCGAARSTPAPPSRPARAVAPGRRPPAHAPAAARQPADAMAPPAGDWMVRPRREDARGRLRHRPLGQARPPRPHPLRPGP